MDWGGIREGESTQRCRNRGNNMRRDRKKRDKITENERQSLRHKEDRERNRNTTDKWREEEKDRTSIRARKVSEGNLTGKVGGRAAGLLASPPRGTPFHLSLCQALGAESERGREAEKGEQRNGRKGWGGREDGPPLHRPT